MADKELDEMLEYLQKKNGATIWDMETLFEGKDEDIKQLLKIFNPQQLAVLRAIISKALYGLGEWHNSKDSDAHPDIQEKINDLSAKFRNHRHETGKTFSAKPEY